MGNKKLKRTLEEFWPKTKTELEKAIKNAKILLNKGEKYIKVVSEKSAKSAKKLSFALKREKLYFDLGRAVSETPKEKWGKTKEIDNLVADIRALSKNIKKIR